MAKQNKYWPDVAIPPGVTLLESIEELGMSQTELADRMGRPIKTINEIIKGKAAITPETALQLERVLHVPARFWNNLEMNFRDTLARIEERSLLQEQLAWLKKIPVKFMVSFGWIQKKSNPIEQLEQVLAFYSVASIKGWEKVWDKKLGCAYKFRKSEKIEADEIALSAWLRAGQVEASSMQCEPYDANKFETILPEIRKLTNSSPDIFVPELKKICASTGVAVVFIRELPKVPVNGVTHWLSSKKAIIQLSLRYKTDDHLWFSFFHEAGHVLMHGKRDFVDDDIIQNEDFNDEESRQWEDEANLFASKIIIPQAAYEYFLECRSFTESSVVRFAKSQGISAGIIVGRLQHDGYIPFNRLNHLKQKFQWG